MVRYLGTRESPPLRVVGSSSKMEEMSLPSGTEMRVYMTFSLGVRRRARKASCSKSSWDRRHFITMETQQPRGQQAVLTSDTHTKAFHMNDATVPNIDYSDIHLYIKKKTMRHLPKHSEPWLWHEIFSKTQFCIKCNMCLREKGKNT